ncbi:MULTISPECIES: hypothetical protein [Staphylococcus]|uniref:hypothetical protein n=1 Tax=Staphylococcus TaxID=1279 RepID=UPI0008A9397A|nr:MULTISPECIES: hypothetical protein [Staphylococcus]OHQ31797.1 hypothetical protein HMPREF2548_10540 [Staphylococcus sp. HMSC067G10]OHQ40571.1 hypothetical protein HMPREF2735_08070 [Staphylococcus sp. HMSC069E07]
MSLLHERIKANYWKGVEAVGGHIVFEDDGFRFTPHSFNIQADSVFVPYQHIQEVSKVNTLFIIPNGVKIIDKNKNVHKIVVNQREKIFEFLNEMK